LLHAVGEENFSFLFDEFEGDLGAKITLKKL
jgi:hypothetical protein